MKSKGKGEGILRESEVDRLLVELVKSASSEEWLNSTKILPPHPRGRRRI